MKVRKKSVTVEAVQFTGDNWYEMGAFCGDKADMAKQHREGILLIDTLEGEMKANAGDMIIKGVEGEFYPCKPNIFEKTYEIIEDGIDE